MIAEGKEFQRETVAGKNDPSLRTEEQGGKAREGEFRKEQDQEQRSETEAGRLVCKEGGPSPWYRRQTSSSW